MAAAGRRLIADPRPTFDELQTSWEACRDATFVTDTFAVGGLVLRIEGFGSLPPRMLPALSHHPRTSADPDLTVRIWDLSVTAVRPLVPHEFFHARGDRDVLDGFAASEARVRYDWPQQVIQAWDADSRTAWWVAERPDTVEWWEEAAPFRPVLAWWLTSRERYFAHGAALSRDGKAVMLVGPGGSGKSTTALRANRAGLDFLGDDYCLIGRAATAMAGHADGAYQVGSIYRTVKLRPVDGPAFESELARNEVGRKIVLSIDDGCGGRMVTGAQLVGVAAVEVAETSETNIETGRPGRVLQALAPTTFDQLPGVGGRSLAAFGAMLRTVPTGVVRLGADADGVVEAVRSLLEEWS